MTVRRSTPSHGSLVSGDPFPSSDTVLLTLSITRAWLGGAVPGTPAGSPMRSTLPAERYAA